MPKRRDDHDPNRSAARVIRETTRDNDELPADAEAAWAAWPKRIERVDAHAMMLRRTTLATGVMAGRGERRQPTAVRWTWGFSTLV